MESFEEYLKSHQIREDHGSDFFTYYNKLLQKKKLKDSDVYKATFMSRQTFNKIINGQMFPSLKNATRIAIGLQCSGSECKLLLKKFGYTLASSSMFALIIRYALDNKIYDIFTINEILLKYNQETL